MKQPVRWAAEDSAATPELREAIRHAQRYAPAHDRVAAVTAAVLAELQPLPPTAATRPPSQGRILGAGAAKIATVCLGATLAVGIGWSAWHGASVEAPQPAAFPRIADQRSHHQPAPAPAVDTVPAPEGAPANVRSPQPEAIAVVTAPEPRKPARVATRQARDAARSAISDDASLLQSARRTRRQSPATALNLLDEHAQRHPKSALREEREALRIEIMRQVDPAVAKTLAAQFDIDFPGSVYARKRRP